MLKIKHLRDFYMEEPFVAKFYKSVKNYHISIKDRNENIT